MIKHCGVLFLCFWWGGWLSLSYSPFNPLVSPSFEVSLLYIISLFSVFCGYFFTFNIFKRKESFNDKSSFSLDKKYISNSLTRYSSFSLLLVLLALLYVGAFSSNFSEYFIRVRGADAEQLISGSGLIDYGLKAILYPITLGVLLISFSSPDSKSFRKLLFFSISFLLAFSYYFQVNYPIIFLFILIFYSQFNYSINSNVLSKFRFKSFVPLCVLTLLVFLAAFNRFGSSDLSGVVTHYLISYHTLGFALFDFYYNKPESLLHCHSFGLSLLASFEFIFSYFLNFIGVDGYVSTSVENVMHNSIPINLGTNGQIRYGNAFGTYLFSFYRDFNYIGVILYSFFYGTLLGILNLKAYKGDRFAFSLYLYFISMGTIAIYVSPLDYSYFWTIPIFMFFIKYKFRFR